MIDNPSLWFSKIAIVRTDVKKSYFPTEEAYIAEAEVIERARLVAATLRDSLGIETKIFAADNALVTNLDQYRPELCINFVDTLRGQGALAAGIPTIFDLLGLPYVGAGALGLSLNTNKYLTKTLLEAWDIPTPRYQLLRTPGQELEYDLRYPLIAKLNEEHGSVGISQESIATNEKELRARVKWLMTTYQQPVLIEEFIDNATELTGLVLEGKQMNTYLAKRDFEQPESASFKLIGFETKWATDLGQVEPVEYNPVETLDKNTINAIKRDLKQAFGILRMDDFGRFDVLIDKYQNYFIVDANANPSLGPESSAARAAAVTGTSFEQILKHILLRNKLDLGEEPDDQSGKVHKRRQQSKNS